MDQQRIFLLPGEYHVTRRPCQMATLLGSCVAVCLSHRDHPYAAMNHFMLARGPEKAADKGRYGDLATETIVWLLQKLDAQTNRLQARLYGGAAVVGHLGASNSIGEQNIVVAREILAGHGIKVVEEDVGGTRGRRIYFDTGARKVRVRTMEKSAETDALEAKRTRIATGKTRVLVVDDSALVRKILRSGIEATRDLEVCGEAADAFQARDLILSEDPDVISLDIIMPRLDGLSFLKKLSQHFPKPVVICSTIAKDRSKIADQARTYGAVDVVDKDTLELYKGKEVLQQVYIPKLRRAALQVVRKRIFDR